MWRDQLPASSLAHRQTWCGFLSIQTVRLGKVRIGGDGGREGGREEREGEKREEEEEREGGREEGREGRREREGGKRGREQERGRISGAKEVRS